jgi:hypothetical protein
LLAEIERLIITNTTTILTMQRFMIAPEFAIELFQCDLAIDMWSADFYDFLSQIDGDYE